MRVNNHEQFPQHPIWGESPHIRWGLTAPDGDADPWSSVPVGSLYAYKNETAGSVRWYQKMENAATDVAWATVGGKFVITATVTWAMMTDGGSTIGTYDLLETIPVGAFVQRALLSSVTGFTGNTSATIQIGDGSDVDRYSTGTPSVFTTSNAIDLGAVSGTAIHVAAVTPRITITSATDFTLVTAGSLTLRIYCLL